MNNDYQNPQNDKEMDAMRQQMSTLKKKLDQQEIVNDHIIRQSMRKTANSIKTRYYAIMAISLMMIPYTYMVLVIRQGISCLLRSNILQQPECEYPQCNGQKPDRSK